MKERVLDGSSMLIFWPKDLSEKLKSKFNFQASRSDEPAYIVGMKFEPSTFCITGGFQLEFLELKRRLKAFNDNPSAQASGASFQVLGQLSFSDDQGSNRPPCISKHIFHDANACLEWINAFYETIAGQEILRFASNRPEAPGATVIYYQKPTGKDGPFYALAPFRTPSHKGHAISLESHCRESRVPGEDPISDSLLLINISYTLDAFMAHNKPFAIEKTPDSLYIGQLPLVTKYSITARQTLYRLRVIRESFCRRDLLWHIVLDMAAGGLFSMALVQYCDPVWLTKMVDHYTVTVLKSFVGWLVGYPAGLKINLGLTSFLGELILWLIYLWEEWTHPWKQVTWLLVWLVGGVGVVFGLTGALAALSDMFALATLHLRWFYYLESRIYVWHFSLIRSLYHLFRGKKYNVLHRRIDSCDYDVEQLIIGTILFTILIFLFPTISVYYLVSVSAWLITVSLLGFIEVILSIANHFPVYTFMRRLFLPSSLPYGINLRLLSPLRKSKLSKETKCWLHTVDFEMKSVPLPISDVFSSYDLILRHISWSFSRTKLFSCLVSGKTIYPLSHFQLPSPDQPEST
ncbi:pig-Q [Entomophthora muscae]|uniref:Pig-Q n=1 Tax=Entomophthora muscae TaxID=34485 RepID=A0ACC2U9G0_9FUNG|nr:pig-Q [Entomophthora muscae]